MYQEARRRERKVLDGYNVVIQRKKEDNESSLDKSVIKDEPVMLQVPQSQQQAAQSETGRGRVVLPRGKSLMDWIRLTSNRKCLATGRRISAEELEKHTSQADCWILIADKVYDISEYLSFHPGGIDQLMRAAGTDATELFNEYHSWVNYDTMLKTCMVGYFVDDRSKLRKPEDLSEITARENEQDFDSANIKAGGTLQGELRVGCSHWAGLTDDNVSVDLYDDQLRILLHFNSSSPKALLWSGANTWMFSEPCSKSVADETITLRFKQDFDIDIIPWWKSGTVLFSLDSLYRNCQVMDVRKITHNTLQIELQTPAMCHLAVPIGHHLLLRINTEDSFVERAYTPISISKDGRTLIFFVKIYEDGLFTSNLKYIKKGDEIAVSDPLGAFDVYGKYPEKALLLAAGTGITPMIRLIEFRGRKNLMTTLLLFNRKEADIPSESTFQQWGIPVDSPLLQIVHCLSEAESHWTGRKGLVSKDLLLEQIGEEQNRSEEMFYVCGPDQFVKLTFQLLTEVGVSASSVHLFQG